MSGEIWTDPCDDLGGHEWEITEDIGCDDCGNHTGWICVRCWDVVDYTWYERPEGAPGLFSTAGLRDTPVT